MPIVDKQPINIYVENIIKRRNNKGSTALEELLTGLSDNQLPYETEQRLIGIGRFSKKL